ncbi:putative enzyme yhhN [Salmonella enterica subsp. enterica serovar Daytona]|uniref:Putative enzyme yhhN n=1 Tax=Salmonella enterica subsp. enterica serovar Daytona TaxID=1962639 RepID=A0A447JAP5_SALET|nr:putative enzyme yhhN [Salmonella enterica subsp. enterica serovar Daytona]
MWTPPIAGQPGNAGFFKPVTLLLLLLLAWQAPMFGRHQLSCVGRTVRLAGRRCVNALAASTPAVRRRGIFLSHLLYTIYFASQMTLSFFWPLPLALLIVGALLIAVIWTRLEELRWPVCTFIAMTLVMVWLAGELWFFRPTAPALSAFTGATLLFIGNIVWLGSHYRRRFRADNAIAAACYFAGHFLIVRSLYL